MTDTRKALRIGAWTATGVLALGTLAGAATAFADAPSSPPAATSPATHTGHRSPAHRGHRWTIGGWATEYGQVTVRAGHHGTVTRTFDLQNGTLTSVSGTTLVVTSADGHAVSYTLDSATKIRNNRQTAAASSLLPGERVHDMALVASDGVPTARVVVAFTPKPKPAGTTGGSTTSPSTTAATSAYGSSAA
ncbi:MAG: hypothetical protein ACYCXA_13025 [Actinomycetes bacterium]